MTDRELLVSCLGEIRHLQGDVSAIGVSLDGNGKEGIKTRLAIVEKEHRSQRFYWRTGVALVSTLVAARAWELVFG